MGYLYQKKKVLLLTNNSKRCRMKSAFVHSSQSTQYQFIHFNEAVIRVLLYNCAMRGDFLPSPKPLSVLLLLHLQKLIVNTFGMYSLTFPFYASDVDVGHSLVFDLHTKHTLNLVNKSYVMSHAHMLVYLLLFHHLIL